MIQGTASNAGKSLVAAGFCRIFKQDGYRVAPFKSQNMALNSFITADGNEMGRAQVVQAEAAGINPSVRMNPVLLKPTSDRGCQVIVNGEILADMNAAEYYGYKPRLIPHILKAYRSLAREYEIVVIEGAGSPAEINLQENDIVNMGIAKMAQAPVLLVADIDRGGVFAAIYGTVMLLEEEERKLIKGTVINKFRGDPEILRPGITMIEKKTGIPVLGVVPYLNIDIEDEDSLAERIGQGRREESVDIAVIRLPRMSNFTDFNVFEQIPGVALRYVGSVSELKNPDMIILPGTKNTMGDLCWLRQNGLEVSLKKQAAKGTVIFGVCGGYQMLGKKLADPDQVEQGGSLNGMDLLDCDTVFAKKKTRTRVGGVFNKLDGVFAGLSGINFSGYEIHMGITETGKGAPLTRIQRVYDRQADALDGCVQDNVMGSYVHGLFDQEQVAPTIAGCLMKRKGLNPAGLKPVSRREYKEQQYERLAQAVRKSMDMAEIYKILETGV